MFTSQHDCCHGCFRLHIQIGVSGFFTKGEQSGIVKSWRIIKTKITRILVSDRPFHGFLNFPHGPVSENPSTWKERLKISTVAKFESDRMKTNKDMAASAFKG